MASPSSLHWMSVPVFTILKSCWTKGATGASTTMLRLSTLESSELTDSMTGAAVHAQPFGSPRSRGVGKVHPNFSKTGAGASRSRTRAGLAARAPRSYVHVSPLELHICGHS